MVNIKVYNLTCFLKSGCGAGVKSVSPDSVNVHIGGIFYIKHH